MIIPSMPGPQEPGTSDLPEPEPPVISAVIPGRLAAPAPPGTVAHLREEDWWKSAQAVASDWQVISRLADFWELALVPPVQPGRGRELAGLIAGAGEQLALGLTALVEAELWRLYRRDRPTATLDLDEMDKRVVDAAQEMGHRAMAEPAPALVLSPEWQEVDQLRGAHYLYRFRTRHRGL